MPRIVISNNQNRIKDSYASAAVLNLTLRSNGEEQVMVMDSLGNFVPAGFDAPTVAPAFVSFAAIGLTPSKWVAYRYVYAATKRYPLVENAITAGGDISPRSNPSPKLAVQIPAAPATGSKVTITVTKAQRQDLDKIWIYRTDYYDTQQEAEDAADAGLAYFVAAVTDDGTAGTVAYTDDTVIVTGNELLETDNFTPQNFQFCKFDDPYFYGVGNFPFYDIVTVTTTGAVELVSNSAKWFDGRNHQRCTLEGITDGGADGFGTYFFKQLTDTTGQLYLDIALTLAGPVSSSGTTRIKIQGEPNILYRSKPRNPFSWGYTEVVGELNVPAPYAFRFGGGQATALEVVPILNLLKIDTEAPNKTFVFNLNGKGTPAFEESKREISSDFSTSNHWSQFLTKAKDNNSYLWFFDHKYHSICQTDGATNVEVSSQVFSTMRNLEATPNLTLPRLRYAAHGTHDANMQLSAVWLSTEDGGDILVTYHYPSDTWATHYQHDVLCSAQFLDYQTGEQITLIGTSTGMIGQAFSNPTSDWMEYVEGTWPIKTLVYDLEPLYTALEVPIASLNFAPNINDLRYIWTNFYEYTNIGNQKKFCYMGMARISDITIVGADYIIYFDKFYDSNNNVVGSFQQMSPNSNSGPSFPDIRTIDVWMFPGSVFCNTRKTIDYGMDSLQKLSEYWVRAENVDAYAQHENGIPEFERSLIGYMADHIADNEDSEDEDQPYTESFATFLMSPEVKPVISGGPPARSTVFAAKNILKSVDLVRVSTVSLTDIGYGELRIYNHHTVRDNA